MSDKVNRSKEDILKYLEDANIGQSLSKEALEPVVKKLSEISRRFNPENIMDFREIVTVIVGTFRIINADIQNTLIKYITGYSMEEIQEYGKEDVEVAAPTPEEPKEHSEPEVLEGDVVELPEENTPKISIKQGMKNLYNRAADTSIINMTVKNFYRGIDVYNMVRGTSTIGNIVKGTLTVAAGLTINTIGATAITTLRLARFGMKKFKAAKGKLAEVMHNKAIRDIEKIEKGLQKQKVDLGKELEGRESAVDKKAAELGFIGDDGESTNSAYKTLVESRKDGEISIEESENAIAERYSEVSQKRDNDLNRISNQVGINILINNFGVTEEQAMNIIENLTYTPDGKIEYGGLDFSELTEPDIAILINSAKRQVKIASISESAKLEAMKYVQIVNDLIVVKEGTDLDKLPVDVREIVNYLKDQEATQEDIDKINSANGEIEFLAMCEEELLGRVAIKANEEMSQEVQDKKTQVKTEQRGFFRSAGEMISGLSLRAKAKAMVEKRENEFINDTIRRNEGASERLTTLARERLQTRTSDEQDKSHTNDGPEHEAEDTLR